MNLKTNLPHEEIHKLLLQVGFKEAEGHGYEILLKPHTQKLNRVNRIHVVYTSDGIDVHKDSPRHHVIKGEEVKVWYEIIQHKLSKEKSGPHTKVA